MSALAHDSPRVPDGGPSDGERRATGAAGAFSSSELSSDVVVVRFGDVDGSEAVEALDALLHWTPSGRVVVVDDGISCAEARQSIRDRASQGAIELLQNDPSRGPAGCFVQAMDLAGQAGVALIAAGTHVGPGWLRGLRSVAADSPEALAVHALAVGAWSDDEATGWLGYLPWPDVCRAAREIALPRSVDRDGGFLSSCVFVTPLGVEAAAAVAADASDLTWPDIESVFLGRGRLAPHVLVQADTWSEIDEELRHELVDGLGRRLRSGAARPSRLFVVDSEPNLAAALDVARGLEPFQSSFVMITREKEAAEFFQFSGGAWEPMAEVTVGQGADSTHDSGLLAFLFERPIDLVHTLRLKDDTAVVDVLDSVGMPTIVDHGRGRSPVTDGLTPVRVPRFGALVVGSERAAARLGEFQSPFERARTRVIEKGADTFRLRPLRRKRARRAGPVRVLLLADWPGDTDVSFLGDLVQAVGPVVEWHNLGPDHPGLINHVGHHNSPVGERLLQAADEIDPDLCMAWTTDPDGFPEALVMSWALSVPVLVPDGTAPAERVRELGGGIVLPTQAGVAARELKNLAADIRLLRSIRKQTRASALFTRTAMLERIRGLYAEAEARWPVSRRIGYVVHGGLGVHGSCEQLRILQRASMIAPSERTSVRQVFVPEILIGSGLEEFDALLVQRDVLGPHAEAALEALRASSTRLVFELDDDLTHIEAADRMGLEADGLLSMRKRLTLVAASAHRVLVSTPELAERLRAVAGAEPVVVPNELDPRVWLTDVDTHARPKGRERRILYMGTRTHLDDLLLLRDVIPEVERRVGRPVVLEVVGVARAFEDDGWITRRDVPKRIENYPQFVPWLRSQRLRWDLAVAPLVDTDFNRCKSDLKLLEYALLGLPVVASEVGPYSGAGHLARLCANDTESWIQAVTSALCDLPGAQSRAALARHHVLQQRVLTPARAGAWLHHIVD